MLKQDICGYCDYDGPFVSFLADCSVPYRPVDVITDSEVVFFLIFKIKPLIKITFLVMSKTWFLYNSYNKHFRVLHDHKAQNLRLVSVKITLFLMKNRILFISWH